MNPQLQLRPWHVGLVLFVIAAAVRVALLPTARFGGDEALFFRIGMDIVEGKSFPLLGTHITDGAARLPGPAFLYLMAGPLLLWRAPEAQFLFTELLGAVTVAAFWFGARGIVGERGAAVAGLFFACAPWATLYADRTWNPNVMPFFVVVAMMCAWRLRGAPTSRAAMVLWPTMALMAQIHMSAPVAWAGVLAVVGFATLRDGWTSSRRHHLLGLALAALTFLPLAISEVQTGFENTRHIWAETVGKVGGVRHPWGFMWVPVYSLRMLTLDVSYHEFSGYWGGPNEWRCLQSLVEGSPPRPFTVWRAGAMASSLVLAVGAIAISVKRALAHREDATDDVGAKNAGVIVAAAVVVIVVNTAMMGLTAKQVFGHYVTNQFPFLVMMLGCAASAKLPMWGQRLGLVLLLVFCVGGVEASTMVSRRVDAKIGLDVHRRVGAVIAADADAAGLPQATPIRLDFVGVRSSYFDWHIFGTRALGLPWHFDQRAPLRRYALTPPSARAPRGAVGDAIDVGAAWLWRLSTPQRRGPP